MIFGLLSITIRPQTEMHPWGAGAFQFGSEFDRQTPEAKSAGGFARTSCSTSAHLLTAGYVDGLAGHIAGLVRG